MIEPIYKVEIKSFDLDRGNIIEIVLKCTETETHKIDRGYLNEVAILEEEDFKEELEKRLPSLIDEFSKAMEEIGFTF